MSRTGPDRGVLGAPLPEVASWGTDPYADALRNGHGPLFLRRTDGWLLPLDVERWCAVADAADLSALSRCEGPVLDIGCGPGRLVAALAARGHRALGIDVSEAAVTRTLRLGGSALHRSVFEPLPGEGRWGTVLLADGNVGIGGDPRRLLHRTAELLAPGGLLVAETAPQDIDERVLVQLDDGRAAGSGPAAADPFPWARLGTPALLRYARPHGLHPADQWDADGRSFVSLRRGRTVRNTSQSPEPRNSTAVISSQFPRNTSGDSPLYGS
ncbi:bifunctional 2-polyprenyl-6-hydroxyphenol methylase/3-demethylubiquinol 3-O-methyltransferase UbiG [Streptomyces atratus]|uniref:class I SAM-dependent methyltransferase n=1 Tax=Streptomyces atratus TaxID=1893 RepID=UPI0021A3AEF3|nr:class I SAM-dependent methyltransferase [Streptomyces atratus]MCT2543063.1 class I SAM-dependent methyltransferase [Streptomyces atratus]